MSVDPSLSSHLVARVGFVSTIIFSSIQIFLTFFVSRNVFGSYKTLITIFAAFSMIFSVVEVLVYPKNYQKVVNKQITAHNKGYVLLIVNVLIAFGNRDKLDQNELISQNVLVVNYGLSYFSLKRPFHASIPISNVLLSGYTWFYAFTISFLAVLFIYRYWAIFDNSKIKYFGGANLTIWIAYCSFFGFQYSIVDYYSLEFDEVSFEYFKESVSIRYNVSLDEIPSMAMLAFNPKTGVIRWRNLTCFMNVSGILGIQYIIMICCGWKMHREMEQKIKNFSSTTRLHHQQFFKTLIIQISAPTLTLFAPLVFIISLPVFNLEVDMPLGFLLCSFTLYPAIDSIIVMYVVTDYKKVALKLWKKMCKTASKQDRETRNYKMSAKRTANTSTSINRSKF